MKNKLAVMLFGSVGLNLFLLGVSAVHVIGGPRADRGAAPAEAPPYVPATSADAAPSLDARPADQPAGDTPGRAARGTSAAGRAAKAGKGINPVMLEIDMLRQMVRAMGGPEDERVKTLWRDGREERQKLTQDVRQAHIQLRAALRAEPFAAENLRAAFQELHASQERAQSYAQDRLVELSQSMTAAERQKFRTLQKRGNPGRDQRGPHHGRKGQGPRNPQRERP